MPSPRILSSCLLVFAACDASEPPAPVSTDWPGVELLTVKTAVCSGMADPLDAPGATLRTLASHTAGAYRDRLEATMVCVEAATTCDAVLACIDAELVADCTEACEGTVARRCRTNTLALREDCALHPGGRTECSNGYCASPSCSTESGPACDGNVLKSCVNERSEAIDCAQFGGTCGATPDGTAACVFEGVACEDVTPPTCSGDTLITCEMDKGHALLDCGELPFPSTCTPGTGATPTLCGAAEPQGPIACVPSCVGSVLNGCVGNWPYTLDCGLMPGAVCGDGANGEPTCLMP